MISQRVRGLFSILTFLQILLALGLFWLCLGILKVIYIPDPSLMLERYLVYSLLVVLALILAEATSRRNDSFLFGKSFDKIQGRTIRQIGFVGIGLLLFLVAAKDPIISRAFLFTFIVLLYVVLLLSNRVLPVRLASGLFKNRNDTVTLLVGTIEQAGFHQPWLTLKRPLGMTILGLITVETAPPVSACPFPILGHLTDLSAVAKQYDVNQVVVLGFPLELTRLRQVIHDCEYGGIRLLILSDLQEKLGVRLMMVDDEGTQILALRSEPLENPFSRAIKRLLDVAVSLPVIVFILPGLTAAVWLLQRWQSPGPIFYLQERGGQYGRSFRIIKYRTMRADNTHDARQATSDDERVYPIGRWLRKLSLDEIPQFLNVLWGDMSVVGPRPHLLQHDETFAKRLNIYRVRSFVKPGITGLAQMKGFRGETKDEQSLRGRIELDLYYLENWSVWLDLWIILRTTWQLLVPFKTAY